MYTEVSFASILSEALQVSEASLLDCYKAAVWLKFLKVLVLYLHCSRLNLKCRKYLWNVDYKQ